MLSRALLLHCGSGHEILHRVGHSPSYDNDWLQDVGGQAACPCLTRARSRRVSRRPFRCRSCLTPNIDLRVKLHIELLATFCPGFDPA